MTLQNNRWQIAPSVPESQIERFKRTNSLLLQVLYNRGITRPEQVKSFLTHEQTDPDDPFLMQDMELAVNRVKKAIRDGESIAIYGDYDADGVTGTVLLTEALRAMGAARVQPYIPHRIDEGYGLGMIALERLASQGNTLVITVDCGIRAVEQIHYAASLGVDVIVTDHHTVGENLPPAVAVIDPKQPDDAYPDDMLAGVGVAYKLVQGLCQSGIELCEMDETELLDLVALGTVTDLVPLLKENRLLADKGLQVLRKGQRPGLAALMEISRLKPEKIDATTIGFVLGPRLNAAGRMAHAYTAARLLITRDRAKAVSLAQQLNKLNEERRNSTRLMSQKAEELAMDHGQDAPLLFAADADFPSGIVGLIASRLQEAHYRPAVVAQVHNDRVVGSCRSIPEFHMTFALDRCQDLLEKHGGHAAAAGFTVNRENLVEFRERLTDLAREELDGMDLIPTLTIDGELQVHDIIWEVQESLARLEPCGYGNPTPLLYSPNVKIVNHRRVGAQGEHLKLMLEQDERSFDGIAFRMGDKEAGLEEWMDIVYYLEINEYNGNIALQLNVKDMRPACSKVLEIAA